VRGLLPSLSRATPSAVSEHSSELIGCPISRSLTTYCVRLELRSRPSTGITRLPRYNEPLRLPRAPGLSLAGVRLVIPDHALGPPVLRTLSLCTCCRHYPGTATGGLASLTSPQSCQPSPIWQSGRPVHCVFSRLAQRSLALRPVHSRRSPSRDPPSEGFSHSSIAAPVASGWSGCRVGLAPTGKRRLCTAHAKHLHSVPRDDGITSRKSRANGHPAPAYCRASSASVVPVIEASAALRKLLPPDLSDPHARYLNGPATGQYALGRRDRKPRIH
jgi:hypothetical protein